MSNQFLVPTLLKIYQKPIYQGVSSLREIEKQLGSMFEQYFNLTKNIFAQELTSKLNQFRESFLNEYYGTITRLKKNQYSK